MGRTLTAFAMAVLAAGASTQDGSIAGLLTTVREGLRIKRADIIIAGMVHDIKLTERLQDEAIEELQSEGAGPETLEELDRQRDLTRKLGAPAQAAKLFDAPPEPGSEEQSRVLEKARENALQYTAGLPDFLCTEFVRRYEGSKQDEWRPTDTLKMDVAYSEKGERYRLLQINGRPTTKTLREIGGFSSNGEFGSLLKWIFDPKSATDFRWEHWTNLRGHPTYVFSYHIDKAHSQYSLNWKTFLKTYAGTTGMRGLVYLDRETNQVMRFSDEADGIPSNWPLVRTPAVLDYDYAEVGGQRFLLPRKVDVRVERKDGQSRNVVEFGKYRKFASEATVTFDK
jgi:hypothetical protein